MIAIIDYNTGNLCSVRNALDRLGASYVITSDADTIRRADHVLLPGVGEAASAMRELRQRRLDSLIPTLTQPVLGICIGIQLLCRHSDEGDADCLGIFDTDVCRLQAHKVPEMGWNTITGLHDPLFRGIAEESYVYYVHSFAPALPVAGSTTELLAATTYGDTTFAAALRRDNFIGTQFHPEKSGDVGEQILRNFITL